MPIIATIYPPVTPWLTGQAGPKRRIRFKDKDTGQSVDITGATLSGKFGTVTLGGTFAIESGPAGLATYAPVAADGPVTAGRFQLQFTLAGAPGPSSLLKTELVDADVQVSL